MPDLAVQTLCAVPSTALRTLVLSLFPQGSSEAAALHREEELLRLSRALSDAHATIDLLHTR